MRITLITPPSAFLLDERVFISLGILKVGAVLEQAGHAVEHLDLSGIVNYAEVAGMHAAGTPPDCYAITATTPQIPAATRIAHAIRATGTHSRIILGGPHPTLTHSALRHSERAVPAWQQLLQDFDIIVCGDGEKAVLSAVNGGESVVDADDPKSVLWMSNQDFNDSPWPARHLVDLDSYRYSVDGERAISLIAQLGCPFKCAFCAGRDSAMLRRIRLRTSEDVTAEMIDVYETYGIKGFMLFDDEVNVNRQILHLMHTIGEAARSRNIEWKLRGFLKAELFTSEQAEAMCLAGFRQVLIGFESGHDRILTNIEKNATREDNTRAVDIAHAAGLKVKALMSLGHAGETEETVLATRDWLLEVKPDDFDCTIITPYPGSPYYDRARLVPGADDTWRYIAPKTGDKLYMSDVDFAEDAQYYKGAPGAYVSYVWTDQLSRERLVELRDELENDVRGRLGISFYPTGTHTRFEASMGQTKLPGHILRGAIAMGVANK
jgi:anaerobic magnesium-protoporphyrin IX monomethyl ester cyclase